MSKTAIVYARVSDRRQAEEDVSVPTQIELAHRRAAELGATVLRVFSDLGRSAFKEGGRAAFAEAIEFATSMGCSYFICWSSSRFARNRFEAALYKRALDKAEVKLVYLASNIDTSTDEGWLADAMFELIDEMTSRNISKDTKRSMIRNAQMGYFCGSRPPFGFQVVPDRDQPRRRRLAIEPSETDLVQRIFAMRVRGLGAYQIAVTLNAEGILYRHGATWSKANILAVLRNEAAIGLTVYNRTDSRKKRARAPDEWVRVESHQPIIERALWDRVQTMMDAAAEVTTKGSPHSAHAFTGILRCGSCGGGMVIETGRGRHGKQYSYYRCRRVRQAEECGDGRRFPAPKLDAWLGEVLLSRVLTPDNLREITDAIAEESGRWGEERRQRASSTASKITDLRARNARLYELLELHGRDAPNLGDLTTRLRENNDQIRALEAEAAALESATAAPTPQLDAGELAAFLRGLLENPDNAKRARTFYASFINGIAIKGNEAVIEYDPARLLVASPARGVTWRGSQSAKVASRWFHAKNRRVVAPLVAGLVARVPVSAARRASS